MRLQNDQLKMRLQNDKMKKMGLLVVHGCNVLHLKVVELQIDCPKSIFQLQ